MGHPEGETGAGGRRDKTSRKGGVMRGGMEGKKDGRQGEGEEEGRGKEVNLASTVISKSRRL